MTIDRVIARICEQHPDDTPERPLVNRVADGGSALGERFRVGERGPETFTRPTREPA